jgi:alpha-tubulin suppressor-like RCC1 family protein
VFGWGDNSYGQIKSGMADAEYPFPIEITSDFYFSMPGLGNKWEMIVNVFAGYYFSIAVSNKGNFYGWGGEYQNSWPIQNINSFFWFLEAN